MCYVSPWQRFSKNIIKSHEKDQRTCYNQNVAWDVPLFKGLAVSSYSIGNWNVCAMSASCMYNRRDKGGVQPTG